MVPITAAMVMQLRERTGAGMMECKKFLTATNGDIEQAIIEMRKAGQARADKKAGRVTAQGRIVVAQSADKRQAVMLEVNSETDFVARDDNFIGFVEGIASLALTSAAESIEALMPQKLNTGRTVEETRLELISKVGENINIRRMARLSSSGVVGSYLHDTRIGVLVALKNDDEMLAKDIAMHIAATSPLVVSQDQVSADAIEREREIFTAQALESGKPQEVVDKMIEGRLNKFKEEICLLGQSFVKEPEKKIAQLLKEKNNEVLSFIRFEVGEGIEKVESNFAEEVMSQVRGE